MRARALKARAATPFPEALTGEQLEAVLGCCRRPRESFLVVLLRDTGMRIGEALGLRREDMHLLPDSRALGCAVVGAHVHVRHRANPNGALAKSRFPRTVPVSDAVLAGYGDYQHERAELVGEDGTEMVLVNLYHQPLGAPMTYRAAKGFFDRLARRVRIPGPTAHAAPHRGHQLGEGRGRSGRGAGVARPRVAGVDDGLPARP